jgi:hypothetical protein
MKKIISIFFIISAIFITSCDEAKNNKPMRKRERPCPAPVKKECHAPVKKECNSCTSKADINEALEIESNDKISAKVESIDSMDLNEEISESN